MGFTSCHGLVQTSLDGPIQVEWVETRRCVLYALKHIPRTRGPVLLEAARMAHIACCHMRGYSHACRSPHDSTLLLAQAFLQRKMRKLTSNESTWWSGLRSAVVARPAPPSPCELGVNGFGVAAADGASKLHWRYHSHQRDTPAHSHALCLRCHHRGTKDESS